MMRRIGLQWLLPLKIQAAAKLLGWKRHGDTYHNGDNFCVWYKSDDGIKVSMDAEPVEAGLDAALLYIAECEAKIPKDVYRILGAYVASIRGLEIELDHRHAEDSVTLAHELGHHVAIRFHGDFSEEGADREAGRIFRQVLSDRELDVALDDPNLRPLLVSEAKS